MKIALANWLLLFASVCWGWSLRRGAVRWRRASLYLPLWAYVAASAAAVVFSQDPGHSVWEIGELATLVLVPMTVTLMDVRRWDGVLKALATVAVGSSLVGLWQYVHGASDLSHRLTGLATHYMTFSGWTLIVVLLLLADIVFHRDRRRLLWTLPSVAVCIVALLLSFTRNAWVGLVVGLVLVAAVWKPRAFLLYPIVAALLLFAAPRSVVDRIVSIVDLRQPANYDRLCMVVSAAGMVQDNPLCGVGLGMVERRYPVYRRDDAPRWRIPHLHNNLLQIAAERGLFGLAAYLWILGSFVRHTWHALRRAGPESFPSLAGTFLAVAGVTAAGFFEYNWGDAEVWILTLACLAAPYGLAPEGS